MVDWCAAACRHTLPSHPNATFTALFSPDNGAVGACGNTGAKESGTSPPSHRRNNTLFRYKVVPYACCLLSSVTYQREPVREIASCLYMKQFKGKDGAERDYTNAPTPTQLAATEPEGTQQRNKVLHYCCTSHRRGLAHPLLRQGAPTSPSASAPPPPSSLSPGPPEPTSASSARQLWATSSFSGGGYVSVLRRATMFLYVKQLCAQTRASTADVPGRGPPQTGIDGVPRCA